MSDTQNTSPNYARHLLRYGRDFAPDLIARAEGSWLYTEDGRSILDFSSGQMCATIGHNHPAITAAMVDAASRVLHLDSTMVSRDVVDLAERLVALLPDPLNRVQFLNTGGEANEAAIRLAKIVTGRHEIIALTGSWHGTTSGASAATYAHGRRGYGPTVPGALAIPAPNCYRCPMRKSPDTCGMACLDLGFEMVDASASANPAAMIIEPIQSAGGIIVPPDGYLARVKEKCRERGILLIFDESQTGLGRTGRMFGFDHEGVVPDILTLSKTLGGGLPLSAVITSDDIADRSAALGFSHYTSHASDPLTAAVGLAVLNVIESEGLAAKADETGTRLLASLADLQSRHPVIGDIRGHGLLLGVEIITGEGDKTPGHALIERLTKRAYALGLNLNKVGGPHSVWRFAPPLNISAGEIETTLEILERVFVSET